MMRFSPCLFLLTLVAFAFGQGRSDKPNFSGTWRLTESKNVATNNPTGTYSKTLVIVHHEPEIKMTIQFSESGQSRSLDETYFTDGRGETNRTFRGQIVESKTRWDGSKLEFHHVDTTSVPVPSGGTKVVKLERIEKWQLSKDAKTLTQTTSLKGPPGLAVVNAMGSGPAKEVFTRRE
jgi:hypothetical protein